MRPEKKAIIDELKGYMEDSEYLLLVDYQGLNVDELAAVRGVLRDVDSKLNIAKNSLVVRAADELDRELGDILTGPTAVVTGDGEVTEVAKKLAGFAGQYEPFTIKGGCVGEDAVSADDVYELSRIPSLEVMRGMVVGTIAAPMSGLVGVMSQKVSSLLYVLKAIEEKKSGA
ncbi:MAG: 50S ribosomal protein L10 [Kiritimatiellia bacterium]|jgi:large subunit ribosomal protein L10|nr:50S ribosomal protein L10 [Kiritimatiellia bacterium]MDP6848055.1 50S ribosomal protein L10 [Kiritimatiellia bacterium]